MNHNSWQRVNETMCMYPWKRVNGETVRRSIQILSSSNGKREQGFFRPVILPTKLHRVVLSVYIWPPQGATKGFPQVLDGFPFCLTGAWTADIDRQTRSEKLALGWSNANVRKLWNRFLIPSYILDIRQDVVLRCTGIRLFYIVEQRTSQLFCGISLPKKHNPSPLSFFKLSVLSPTESISCQFPQMCNYQAFPIKKTI